MQTTAIINHISNWLKSYAQNARVKGFVIGISGGIDSAVTSTLAAKTGLPLLCVELPIHQNKTQVERGLKHIAWLKESFENVSSVELQLSSVYDSFTSQLSDNEAQNELALVNTRARLRMTTLYQVAAANKGIVVGTGNKVEDFGVGFYTKYGDGGVDISPIADCNKSEVWKIGKSINILQEIIDAVPTDGLWDDGRTDEGQLGLKYEELEEAMNNVNSINREKYEKIRKMNLHKMEPIPVCKIPN